MFSLRRVYKFLIILLLLISSVTFAAEDADALFAAEKWSEATDAYSSRVLESPDLRRLRSSGMTPYWVQWLAMRRLKN